NQSDFDQKRRQELAWVRNAHAAVAAGFTQFVELTNEPGDVSFAAAVVLAQVPQHAQKVAEVIRILLRNEKRVANRAGYLLLLGATNDFSLETLSILGDAVNAPAAIERRAAAHAFARQKIRPLPPAASAAMMEAIASAELEASLEEL